MFEINDSASHEVVLWCSRRCLREAAGGLIRTGDVQLGKKAVDSSAKA